MAEKSSSDKEAVRQDWVDIAKALAIMAIVIWHMQTDWPDTTFLHLHNLVGGIWPVPVFFMIAGFFLTNDKLLNPRTFIPKKVLQLYRPTVWLYVGAILLHNVFICIGFYDVTRDYGAFIHEYNLVDTVKQLGLSLCLAGSELILSPLWFACVLFVGLCLMSFSTSFVKRYVTTTSRQFHLFQPLMFFLPAMAYEVASNIWSIHIPRYDQLFSSMWLIYVGMMLRSHYHIQFNNKWMAAVCAATVYGFSTETILPNNLLTYTLCTIAACYALCYVSKLIERHTRLIRRLLAFIGRDSFYIMALHCFGFKMMTLMLNALGSNIDLAILIAPVGNSLWLMTAYLLAGTFVPLALIHLFRTVKGKNAAKPRPE